MKLFNAVLTITLLFLTLFFFSEEKTTVGQSENNSEKNKIIGLLEKVNLLEKKNGRNESQIRIKQQ